MKRFRRWLFNGLAALSLLMCIAIETLWVRSHWIGDSLNLGTANKAVAGILSVDGTIAVFFTAGTDAGIFDSERGYTSFKSSHYGAENSLVRTAWSYDGPLQNSPPTVYRLIHAHRRAFDMPMFKTPFSLMGFKYDVCFLAYPDLTGVPYRYVFIIPSWPFHCVLIAIITILAVRIYRNYIAVFQFRNGLCAHCGYDLRATPDRCPECGAVPTKKEIAAS
jgi:hypothetical protein